MQPRLIESWDTFGEKRYMKAAAVVRCWYPLFTSEWTVCSVMQSKWASVFRGESRFIGESYQCRSGRGTPNSLINSRSHEYGRNRGYAIVNHAIALYRDPGRVLIVINRIRDR